MSRGANANGWTGGPVRHLVLAVAAGFLLLGHAAADGRPGGDAPHRQARHHQKGPSLDGRVAMLSKALGLDAKQRSELRKVLESQREQIMRVWNDPAVPAEYRIPATRAINDRTADQIRELLTDEQKKKYSPPRQPREAAPGSTTASVETGMGPANAR